MPFKQYPQDNFASGQLDPDFIRRADLKLRANSLQTALNFKLLKSGAMKVRSGSTRVDAALGDGWLVITSGTGIDYVVVITANVFRVYLRTTRALVVEIDGCAWSAGILYDLIIQASGDTIYVFHQTIPPQVIKRDQASGTWSVAAQTYASGFSNSIRMPFYRFAPKGVTVTPSALTGAITVTSSQAYFTPQHVGLRLRLGGRSSAVDGREVQITAYSSPTSVSATVIQNLYPTKTISVDTTPSYDVGEVIAGADSNAQGEVISVSGASVTVLMETFTDFSYVSGASPPGERVVGLSAAPHITAAPVLASNAPVLDWCEQAISALRGYPGTGTVHKNRLWMSRLPQIPTGILASAIDAYDDFGVGTNNDDSLFELLGDTDDGVIEHIHSAEQLIVFTERFMLYVPESETNPITPTSFDLLKVGPDGANFCRPCNIAEGVIYTHSSGGTVMGAFPTGDVRRSWKTANMSQVSSTLIVQPRSLAYVSPSSTNADRYVLAVNGDGTMAVLSYDQSDEDAVPGWTLWATNGRFRMVVAIDGELWAICDHPDVGGSEFALEVFDDSRTLDCTVDVDPTTAAGPTSLHSIETLFGPMDADTIYQAPQHAGQTCSLAIGGAYVGEVQVDASGYFGGLATTAAIELGFRFDAECVPWPPLDPEDQSPRRRKRRISGAVVRYRGTNLAVNGDMRPAYDGTDDATQVPPMRDETRRFPCFGWSYEPTVTVTRAGSGPLELLALDLEVSG